MMNKYLVPINEWISGNAKLHLALTFILNMLVFPTKSYAEGVPFILAFIFLCENKMGCLFEVTFLTIGALLLPLIFITPVIYFMMNKGKRTIMTSIGYLFLLSFGFQIFLYIYQLF